MPQPIGLQLYSVRDQLAQDYAGVIRQIAQMGYVGVEPAGYPGSTVDEAKKLYDELGFKVESGHFPLAVGDDKNATLEQAQKLGVKWVISGKGPDQFVTVDEIKRTCDLFNEAHANARECGLTFGIHNHWWEFEQIDGRLKIDVMLECLDPEIVFEMDTYWVTVAGQDPIAMLEKLGSRVKLLHVKDGPVEKGVPMTAVGKGKMDYTKIIPAAKHAEWMVVELDECATDMLEAVQESLQYLSTNNLAVAR